jgi:hypothetical protein
MGFRINFLSSKDEKKIVRNDAEELMSDHFDIVRRGDLGREAWNGFAEKYDESWLWHLYELSDALATWRGSQDCGFALIDRASKNEIVALVPLRRINRRILGLLPVYALESIGGPALKNDLSDKQRRDVLRALRKKVLSLANEGRCVEVRLFTSPMAPAFRGANCPRVNPLMDMGCENALTQTWVVELKPDKDALWSRMDGRARTAIRKAQKAGVVVREAREDDLDTYYDLHVETYRRTGMRSQQKEYFQAIWSHFLKEGLARVWIAEVEGKPVAAENFGVYKNAAVYWTGSASRKGLEVEANSLLQWTAIQWMADNGIEWYETGEAFPQALEGKTKGLNDFKKSFGGELYPFYRARLPVGGWGERLYRFKRNVFV